MRRYTKEEMENLDRIALIERRNFRHGKMSAVREAWWRHSPPRWAWLNEPVGTGEERAIAFLAELDEYYGKHGKYPSVSSKYPRERQLNFWRNSMRDSYAGGDKANCWYPSLLEGRTEHLPDDWYKRVDYEAGHLVNIKQIDAFYGEHDRYPTSADNQYLALWLSNFRERCKTKGVYERVKSHKSQHLPNDWYKIKDLEQVALNKVEQLDAFYGEYGVYPGQREQGKRGEMGLWLQRIRKSYVDRNRTLKQAGSVFYLIYAEYKTKHMPADWYIRTNYEQKSMEALLRLDKWYGENERYPNKEKRGEEGVLGRWLTTKRHHYLIYTGEGKSYANSKGGDIFYESLLQLEPKHLPQNWYLRRDKEGEALEKIKAIDEFYGEHGRYPSATRTRVELRSVEGNLAAYLS
jgi:hypothetical protein